ncbi:MAG: CBS domain-containing protein [Alphaproteobacteria bacterium]|nr:CBS domain-containing protein [Alphaproteobacteria bacterium]
MNVQAILRSKGRSVVTIHPDASVERAIAVLRGRGIGALVVSEDGERVVGILSERDLVEAMGRYGGELLGVSVAEVMSCPVVTCAPDDSVADLMAEMTSRRMRHFPVMQDGRLCGIVSIGDLVKSRLDEIEYEAHSMRSFIAGAA